MLSRLALYLATEGLPVKGRIVTRGGIRAVRKDSTKGTKISG